MAAKAKPTEATLTDRTVHEITATVRVGSLASRSLTEQAETKLEAATPVSEATVTGYSNLSPKHGCTHISVNAEVRLATPPEQSDVADTLESETAIESVSV